MYVEGHQAQYVYKTDGTIDPVQTLAKGLQVTGNVAYNGPTTNFTYYNDAGSEWINWQGNIAFRAGDKSHGGCSPTGHFWITGNYFSAGIQSYPCAQPVDTHASGNTTIPANPRPADLPNALLRGAGAGSGSFTPVLSVPAKIYYVSPTSNATEVLVAGEGFGPATPVYIGTTPAANVTHLSSGFMIVPVPAGTSAGQISVTPQVPGSIRLNDDDSAIAYSGFSYAGAARTATIRTTSTTRRRTGRPRLSPSPAPESRCTASRTPTRETSASASTADRSRSSARCRATANGMRTSRCTRPVSSPRADTPSW